MTGKKVIVLEFDLSDPTLSKKLGVTAEKGLSNYLMGEVTKDEIIIKAADHENMYIIPAGTLPDNPSELITSEKVPELLDYLAGELARGGWRLKAIHRLIVAQKQVGDSQ